MRDVSIISLDEKNTLVIATDNSGAIGLKEHDVVKADYETVSYYTFRVAVMECMSAGGTPISVVVQNFCEEKAWSAILCGIQAVLRELELNDVTITGSTESNFTLLQSALSLTVIGRSKVNLPLNSLYDDEVKIGLVGVPLVGNEVIQHEEQIAPLSIFKQLIEKNFTLLPVGSKGILHETNCLFVNKKFKSSDLTTTIDVMKSAGPSTCFLVIFKNGEDIKQIAGKHFTLLYGKSE